MYPHFIEVHDAGDGQPISVNVENILMFYPDPDEKGSFISFPFTGTGSYQDVTETYSEVKALIEECGCLIHKADPRLDTSNPITKQMIMSENMVGEPVWNSNNGRWYQIANWSNHEDQFYMELQGIWEILKYTDKELKKFPLYRMKRCHEKKR